MSLVIISFVNRYMTKICKYCKEDKALTEFYLTKGYYSTRCKPCFLLYQKSNPNRKSTSTTYYSSNNKRIRAKAQEAYHKDLHQSRVKGAAKRRKLWHSNPAIRGY